MNWNLYSYTKKFFGSKSPNISGFKEGDDNTRFFHKVASRRKRTKLLIDGNEVIEFEEIANAISRFYEKLFAKDVVHHPKIENLFEAILSPELAAFLEGSSTEEEIRGLSLAWIKINHPC